MSKENVKHMAQDQEIRNENKTGNLFEDLSIAQIVAGAAAAVTSMLLASQIGIAGSVIGVAVGSVVATISSQLYKRFLSVSADKIRDLRSSDEADTSSDARILTPQPAPSRFAINRSKTPRLGEDARIDDKVVEKHRARRRKAKVQRSVIVVAIVSALLAVLLSAWVIDLATTGHGIGTKTPSLISNGTDKSETNATSTYDSTTGTDTKSASDTDKSSSSSVSNDSSTTTTDGTDATGNSTGQGQDGSGSQDPSSDDTDQGGSSGTDGTGSTSSGNPGTASQSTSSTSTANSSSATG